MIRLENFELEILNLHNEIDNSFFNKMNNEEQFKEYFGKVIYNKNNSDNIFMKNYLVNYNSKKIGYVYISDKVEKNNISAVTLYYYIDSDYRNRGMATNIIKELLNYLKNKEKINYIILNIHRKNIPSIKVAIQNGFIKNIDDEEEIQFVHKSL